MKTQKQKKNICHLNDLFLARSALLSREFSHAQFSFQIRLHMKIAHDLTFRTQFQQKSKNRKENRNRNIFYATK